MKLMRILKENQQSDNKIRLLQNVHLQNSKEQKRRNEYVSLKQKLAIADQSEILLVGLEKILFIKSESNYSSIYLDNGVILFTSKTLKYWERKIDHSFFIRCHNSFLINKIHADSISLKNSKLHLGNHAIPISRACKQQIISAVIEN